MKRILIQFWKELTQFRRDRLTLTLAFLLPLTSLFILSFADYEADYVSSRDSAFLFQLVSHFYPASTNHLNSKMIALAFL